ncbi:uncharacterized protein LOC135937486 [Cloeon dipterum]|uniref:uncharacterized protein LOC135937486 n=1 Tax=Cloeon dipterum TaxID=197152 RepID=UPI00322064C4
MTGYIGLMIIVKALQIINALEFTKMRDFCECSSGMDERLHFLPDAKLQSGKIGEVWLEEWLETRQLYADYNVDAFQSSRLSLEMAIHQVDVTLSWISDTAYFETEGDDAWLSIGNNKLQFARKASLLHDMIMLNLLNLQKSVVLRRSSGYVSIFENGPRLKVVESSTELKLGGGMAVANDLLFDWRSFPNPTAMWSETDGCIFYEATDNVEGLRVEMIDGVFALHKAFVI